MWCSVNSDTFLSEPAWTFSSIWATVARFFGSDHMGQPLLPKCICFSCLPMTLSLVQHYCFLRALLIDTSHYRLGTPHKSCSFEDVLTQSTSHHSLTLFKLEQILHMSIFPPSNTSNMRTKCLFAPWCISVIHFTCQWSWCYPWSVRKNINVLMSNTYSVFYILFEMQLRHEVSLNRPVSLRSVTANFFDLQLKRESNIVVIIMIAIKIILTEGRPPPLILPVKNLY